MVATRGRTFKRPWRRSCLSSKLKSSSAPIGRKDSWCFHAVGSSNAPLLGSTAAEGLPRIGRTSIATRWRSCGLPQSASCSENFVIPPDVFGQTLRTKPSDLRVASLATTTRCTTRTEKFGRRPNERPSAQERALVVGAGGRYLALHGGPDQGAPAICLPTVRRGAACLHRRELRDDRGDCHLMDHRRLVDN